jgi:hypothetical protein
VHGGKVRISQGSGRPVCTSGRHNQRLIGYNLDMITFILAMLLAAPAAPFEELNQIIDNARVTVRELTSLSSKSAPVRKRNNDMVLIDLIKPAAYFVPKGTVHEMPSHAVLIELKDFSSPPVPNNTSYPLAFPRKGAKKILENDRVIIWDYKWTAGSPTAMHFHDKDVVVVYLGDGQLKSTTPDGNSDVNTISYGLTRFNPPNRTHSEELVKGSARAFITEFK